MTGRACPRPGSCYPRGPGPMRLSCNPVCISRKAPSGLVAKRSKSMSTSLTTRFSRIALMIGGQQSPIDTHAQETGRLPLDDREQMCRVLGSITGKCGRLNARCFQRLGTHATPPSGWQVQYETLKDIN